MKEDPNLIVINDFLIKTSVTVTFYSDKLIFRDSINSFKLDGALLKMMTFYKFNVDHSNPQDRKVIFEFAKKNEI